MVISELFFVTAYSFVILCPCLTLIRVNIMDGGGNIFSPVKLASYSPNKSSQPLYQS